MTIYKKTLVIILAVCFFLNTTVVANASYVDNISAMTVSLEEEAMDKEKERLQKKFFGMKEWIQEAKPYKNYIAKNKTFFKIREELTRFFYKVRENFDEHWNRRFTTL